MSKLKGFDFSVIPVYLLYVCGVMTDSNCVSCGEGVLRYLYYYFCYYYYYYYYYLYHNVNTVTANIMATQTHSPVPLISKGLMVKELLPVRLVTCTWRLMVYELFLHVLLATL
jgi:hypothetical protein